MKNSESMIAGMTVFILLLIWVAGSIWPSMTFAGSIYGGMLALSGTLLMLTPLLLLAVKRIDWINNKVTAHIPMRTLLSWHIYASFLGCILILLHTGHKFDNVLASTLFALTLTVIFSGIVGRYLQRQIGDDVRGKRKLLAQLYDEYDVLLTSNTALESLDTASRHIRALVMERSSKVSSGAYTLSKVVNLVSSIADVESAISSRETLKKWFTFWFRIHYMLAISMYLLLSLHIWSAIHFGLRWF